MATTARKAAIIENVMLKSGLRTWFSLFGAGGCPPGYQGEECPADVPSAGLLVAPLPGSNELSAIPIGLIYVLPKSALAP